MGSAVKCPYCGASAVDITLLDETHRRYLCVANNHEFTDEFAAPAGEPEALIVL